MGRKAKIKQTRRARKQLEQILEQGLETGKIAQDSDGNYKFKDEQAAADYFAVLLQNPELLVDFIADNPELLAKAQELEQGQFEEDRF